MARVADPGMRTRILDAADRLLVRRGFRRMTVETVAREAGIAKGSVYLHFASKEDVALSCIDRMAGGVVARLERTAASRRTARIRLGTMLHDRVLLRFDYARHHASSIDEKLAVMRQAMLERRAAHFGDEAAVIARVVADGVAAGEFAARSPQRTARALVTATNALLPYSLSVRELGARAPLTRRLGDLVALLLAGLDSSRRLPPAPSRRHA